MRMSGCPCLIRRQFRRDPTDALFADQSQSILDNLVALSRRSRAWNCSVGTAAVLSGISRQSFEGNDALDGWGSAICSTADHGSVVRLVAACPPRLPAALAVFQAARGPRSYSAPPLLRARGDYAA